MAWVGSVQSSKKWYIKTRLLRNVEQNFWGHELWHPNSIFYVCSYEYNNDICYCSQKMLQCTCNHKAQPACTSVGSGQSPFLHTPCVNIEKSTWLKWRLQLDCMDSKNRQSPCCLHDMAYLKTGIILNNVIMSI